MMKGLQTPRHIRFEEIDGVIMFLDLRLGTYHAIESVAARMWDSIQNLEERPAIIQSIQKNYPVESDQLEMDFDAFIEQLLKLGFLEKEKPELPIEARVTGRVGVKHLLVMRAWSSLLTTVCSLSVRGFGKTYARYSTIPVVKSETETNRNLLTTALAAFNRAENFFHMKTAPKDCLPRSLALFRFLRAVGLPVEHCIGVKRFPFTAHAWVEHEGEVIYDYPGRLGEFTTLARIST